MQKYTKCQEIYISPDIFTNVGSKSVVPNLGGIPPKGGIWPSLGGNEQLSKTIQHLFYIRHRIL